MIMSLKFCFILFFKPEGSWHEYPCQGGGEGVAGGGGGLAHSMNILVEGWGCGWGRGRFKVFFPNI